MTLSRLSEKELLNAWKIYRGSYDGYLLTSQEAFDCAKARMENPFVKMMCDNVFDCIVREVAEDAADRYYNL